MAGTQIPDQKPPEAFDEEQSEYLSRMFVAARNSDQESDILAKISVVPAKPVIGKAYYFSGAIAPDISKAGYWGWDGVNWVLLGQPDIYFQIARGTSLAVGGAKGTITNISWDAAATINTGGYTHTPGGTTIQVAFDGMYRVIGNLYCENGNADRIAMLARIRLNGATAQSRGRGMGYSRGSAYNDCIARAHLDINLSAGDTVELQSVVNHTDSGGAVTAVAALTSMNILRLGPQQVTP